MRFRTLGPLQVRGGAGWTAIRAPQQRVVLAVLLAEAGRVVSTDRLVDEIWGDCPPRAAVVTVQGYIRRLRRLLGGDAGGPVVTSGRGYEVLAGDTDVDAAVFETLVDAGGRELAAGDLDAGLARLSEALELWRGPAFADVPPGPVLAAAAARLAERRLAAAEDRLGVLLDLGRHLEVIDELGRLVDENPLRQRLRGQWLLALYRCGRRAEALEAYRLGRAVLVAELGREPEPALRELQRAILNGDPVPLTRARPGPAAVRRATPAQLPAEAAGFTGRAEHLRRLDTLLPGGGTVDPVTICGAAGVGKTALAVHWAHRVRQLFPDGQLYVNLRGYGPDLPLRPIDALAGFLPALGVPADQVPIEPAAAAARYRARLAGKRLLVLLDNANHADQVRPLLPPGPGCLALVTSRTSLADLGAAGLTLGVLTPAEARTLLVGQLGADRVDAEPDAVTELAALCGRLPLALRIAAANVSGSKRTIAGYVARLATGDRLAALEVDGDPRSAVRVAFGHSYAALPAGARRLFRLLGLVPGPDVSAPAAAVLAEIEPAAAATALDRLARAHLVEDSAPGRYAMHDLLRLYAANRAAAEDGEPDRRAALGRLFEHYRDRADAASARLYPQVLRLSAPATGAGFGDPRQALAWLDAERPNLVAAVAHAAAHGPYPVAIGLADALHGYLFMRMHTVDWQAIALAGRAAAEAGGDARAQAAAHLSLATLDRGTGRSDSAVEHYTRALALARKTGWPDGIANALGNLGIMLWGKGHLDAAIEHYTEALEIATDTGRLSGQAANLRRLGLVYRAQGRLGLSADHFTRALVLHQRMAARADEARTRVGLSDAFHALGRFDDALGHLTQALAVHREHGDRNREADALRVLAAVHRDAGRPGEALELGTGALTIAADTGNRPKEADVLNTLGLVQDQLGLREQAVASHRRALDLARDAGNRYTETEALTHLAAAVHHTGRHEMAVRPANAALTMARWAGFRLLEAAALTTLAEIRLGQGRLDQALDHAERAVTRCAGTGHRLGLARAHLVASQAFGGTGRDQDARTHRDAAQALCADLGIPGAG
jgi:tetratricopeptide (TPR) repeat protein